MFIIENNEWQDEVYQTVHVRAHVVQTDTGKSIDYFECDYSNQFDTFDLVSDISQRVGNKYLIYEAYINRIEITGIDRRY